MYPSSVASWQPLSAGRAETYARWFGCLSDPTRVRLMHAVAAAGDPVTVGELTEQLGISQSTCSHHLRRLAEVGLVVLERRGTATLVSVDRSCVTDFPSIADVVIGVLAPQLFSDPSPGIVVRALAADDWGEVRRVYAESIAAERTTFETTVPGRRTLERRWLPEHRWVAEVDGRIAGWAAAATVSSRSGGPGVVETSIHLGDEFYGIGVGRALIRRQVGAADRGGLWTLQTSIFPENRAKAALHLAAGFRTLGVHERIGRRAGQWRDTLLLERRRAADPA